jgi:hypothetical protein
MQEKKLQINLEYKFMCCIFVLPNNKDMIKQYEIYVDALDNQWKIQKITAQRKRGTYYYWIAECLTLPRGYRGNTKKALISTIKKLDYEPANS